MRAAAEGPATPPAPPQPPRPFNHHTALPLPHPHTKSSSHPTTVSFTPTTDQGPPPPPTPFQPPTPPSPPPPHNKPATLGEAPRLQASRSRRPRHPARTTTSAGTVQPRLRSAPACLRNINRLPPHNR